MVPYRYDPDHIATAKAAARCQAIKVSGGRCGAPARRKRRYCRFHERRTKPKPKGVISLGYIRDAAGLQDVLVRAKRMIHSPNTDPEARGLMLYALQIEAMSKKNFKEEQDARTAGPSTRTGDDSPGPRSG